MIACGIVKLPVAFVPEPIVQVDVGEDDLFFLRKTFGFGQPFVVFVDERVAIPTEVVVLSPGPAALYK
jgi:hypothetical protein